MTPNETHTVSRKSLFARIAIAIVAVVIIIIVACVLVVGYFLFEYVRAHRHVDITEHLAVDKDQEYVLDTMLYLVNDPTDSNGDYLTTDEHGVDHYPPQANMIVAELPPGTRFRVSKLTARHNPWTGVNRYASIEIASGKYRGKTYEIMGYHILETSAEMGGPDSTWKFRDFVHPARKW